MFSEVIWSTPSVNTYTSNHLFLIINHDSTGPLVRFNKLVQYICMTCPACHTKIKRPVLNFLFTDITASPSRVSLTHNRI